MKIYEMIDADLKLTLGCLLYFEKEKSYIIELSDTLDEWTAPLLFAGNIKNGIFTIDRELSSIWVNERIIPSGRQNIGSILANAKLPYYDEISLLEKSNGKCSQDSIYIKRIKYIPEYIQKRMQHNITECIPCDNYTLLCFFDDGTTRKYDFTKWAPHIEINKITTSMNVFNSAHIAAGGYCVTFNDSIDVSACELYNNGSEIPLSINDFFSFINHSVVDTSDCCELMECSRQNLSNYTSKGLLVPIKKDVKGNLYSKGNIYRNETIEMLTKNCL